MIELQDDDVHEPGGIDLAPSFGHQRNCLSSDNYQYIHHGGIPRIRGPSDIMPERLVCLIIIGY